MELKDFDYSLPEELIAQYPLKERDSSRLMFLDPTTGGIKHGTFRDIIGYLREGDLLILNDTRVIPARLSGRKSTGGKVEVLLCRKDTRREGAGRKEAWKCLVKPSKGVAKGLKLFFDEGVEAEVIRKDDEGLWECEFNSLDKDSLERLGKTPLPPYIKREANGTDRSRYQTVFAGKPGAVAAPTAGLHFTEELLNEIRNKGVEIHYLTLHTGPGTFMPVRVDDIRRHRVLKERYSIDGGVFKAVLKAKDEKRRVIAVGSTSTRALEASVLNGFEEPALAGETGLFIYPGFKFRLIDGLLTNFHLPGSTLIMLVAAFAGLKIIMHAYNEAVKERYRFFSYGDCMLIL